MTGSSRDAEQDSRCLCHRFGRYVCHAAWLVADVDFFRTRKVGATLMGLIQALQGVNYALFPRASAQSMIDDLNNHPVASVAFEIVAGAVVAVIFYWIGATRFGRYLYDDAGVSA